MIKSKQIVFYFVSYYKSVLTNLNYNSMKCSYFSMLILLFGLYTNSFATDFTPISHIFPKVINGAAAWGDYNKDGYYDLAICGDTSAVSTPALVFYVYKNNGDLTFTKIAKLTGLYEGEIKWGDFNNDGLLDIIACGSSGASGSYTPTVKIYQNNNNDTFTEITSHGITALTYSSLDVADLDKDGDCDIVISGANASNVDKTIVYMNNGNFGFTLLENLTGLHHSRIKLGDYNKDGYADIVLSGFNSSSSPSTIVYQNDKDGTFTIVNTGMSAVAYGDICWGDFNNDGFDDVVFSGSNSGYSKKLYKNNYPVSFQDSTDSDIPGSAHSSVDVCDFDMDGDLDMFIMGAGVTAFSQLLLNEGNFSFSLDPFIFPQNVHPTFASADINNDGKVDFLLSGPPSDAGIKNTTVYLNNSVNTNTAPSVPINLQMADAGLGIASLSWDASVDPQGSSKTITYNVYIGTASGAMDKLKCASNISTGKLYALTSGNCGHSNSLQIALTPGITTYYWGVQAIDNSFMASAFSSEGTFIVSTPESVPQNKGELKLKYESITKTIFYSFEQDINNTTSIEIVNQIGIKLNTFSISDKTGIINVPTLLPGIYLVLVNNGREKVVKKILVE